MPAAFVLGPMVAAIAFGTAGTGLTLPRPAFQGAQAIIGCLVARSITAAVVTSFAQDWAAMLIVAASTVATAGVVGWCLGRFSAFPALAAAWGVMPGGASGMVVMAEELGADSRLVALLQYTRMVFVVIAASALTRALLGGSSHSVVASGPAGEIDLGSLAATLAIALAGIALARALRIPAGGLLCPMVLGATLHAAGLVDLALPAPLLAVAYAAIGWSVGLTFTRQTLLQAWRLLPLIVSAALAITLLSAIPALLLIALRHTDPLTAFLATSPGGIDAVAVIALDARADVGFIMGMQTLRVLLVIATAAPLVRLIARLAAKPA